MSMLKALHVEVLEFARQLASHAYIIITITVAYSHALTDIVIASNLL